MLRSLYTAATGMMTQRSKMDVITNNISNLETVGYKSENMISRSFADLMLERANDPAILNRAVTQVGPLNTGTHIDEIRTTFSQGNLESTGMQDDLSIQGDGFFVLATPQGLRYTRAGNFHVTGEGILVNADGHEVLDVNDQPIYVGSGTFAVDAKGEITADGAPSTKIRVVQMQNPDALRKEGSGLYTAFGDAGIADATEGYALRQGEIELSNVDIARQTVDMLITYRAYETNQRMVTMIDESLGLAVNQIAKF